MLILFKTCCVNAGTCISLHDSILKSLFLHFSNIIVDKLDTTMERKKELEASNLHSIDGSNVHSPARTSFWIPRVRLWRRFYGTSTHIGWGIYADTGLSLPSSQRSRSPVDSRRYRLESPNDFKVIIPQRCLLYFWKCW